MLLTAAWSDSRSGRQPAPSCPLLVLREVIRSAVAGAPARRSASTADWSVAPFNDVTAVWCAANIWGSYSVTSRLSSSSGVSTSMPRTSRTSAGKSLALEVQHRRLGGDGGDQDVTVVLVGKRDVVQRAPVLRARFDLGEGEGSVHRAYQPFASRSIEARHVTLEVLDDLGQDLLPT